MFTSLASVNSEKVDIFSLNESRKSLESIPQYVNFRGQSLLITSNNKKKTKQVSTLELPCQLLNSKVTLMKKYDSHSLKNYIIFFKLLSSSRYFYFTCQSQFP